MTHLLRRNQVAAALLVLSVGLLAGLPASAAKRDLQVYFIDVEGRPIHTVRHPDRPVSAHRHRMAGQRRPRR